MGSAFLNIWEQFYLAKKEEELKKSETPKQPNNSEPKNLPKTDLKPSLKIEEVSESETIQEIKPSADQKPDQKVEKSENKREPGEVKQNFTKPTTSFELERDWRSFQNKSTKAAYLKFIDDPIAIARYFAPQLPKYIIDICRNIIKSIISTAR